MGQFNATYVIFRHIFAQMGAFFQLVHLCDMLKSYMSLICGVCKAPYTYVFQTLKKHSDLRGIVKQWTMKLLAKSILGLLAVTTKAQVIGILVQDIIYYCTFKYVYGRLLQKQREKCPVNSIDIDPSLLSNDTFLKFGMSEIPLCCTSIICLIV